MNPHCVYCEPERRANCRLRRDQRAVCFAPRAFGRSFPHSTTPVPLLKPRARHERASAKCRMSGGLPSAARRRALRLAIHSTPLAPLTDHRPKPRVDNADKVSIHQLVIGRISDFQSLIEKPVNHSGGRGDNAMKSGRIVWRRRARQGYYGPVRLGASASVPPLTRPPPPGSCL